MIRFLQIFNKSLLTNCKGWEAELLRECPPHITFHMSRVTCHMSRVPCHMPCVAYIFFLQGSRANRWRVCYQRGIPLPRPVSFHLCFGFVFLFLFLVVPAGPIDICVPVEIKAVLTNLR